MVCEVDAVHTAGVQRVCIERAPNVTRNPKTSRLSQRIDPDLKAKIADEAERRHLDETAIVTIALNEYFERQAAAPAAPTPDKLT